MNKRLLIGLITGASLGVVCILGAFVRSNEPLSGIYLFAFWYNRLIMGLVIGLLNENRFKQLLLKGLLIGTLVSLAFYLSTDLKDLMGFIAGIVYGVIISLAIYRFSIKNSI
jgi:hypothetical protein